MVTEDELVRAIRKVLSGDFPGVLVPVGDDAAVVEWGGEDVVLTTDMLVEGIHFDPATTPPQAIGFKAVSVNVSDVAAMGGSPRFGLVSLGVPGDIQPSWVMELYGGIREAADEHAMAVIGGDTVRADRPVVSVAVVGRVARGRAITRAGARPGDALVVTGGLGGAAGGLRVAEARAGDKLRELLGTDSERELVEALQRPVARVGEGETLAQAGATAMIDISDGLALDLSRLCEAGEIGAEIRLADIPIDRGVREVTEAAGLDPLELALHGGEDYELLAALPPGAVEEARGKCADRFGTSLTLIGEVTEAGLVAVYPGGDRKPLEPRGWDHFA